MDNTPLPIVNIDNLERWVAETKTAGTARYYTAMLSHLRTFCGDDNLDLNFVNVDFVSRFADHLVRIGLKASSIQLFLKSLRATLKEQFGKSHKDLLKAAFVELESLDKFGTNTITFRELRTLSSHPLDEIETLQKTRDVFMMGVYEGGLTFEEMQQKYPETGCPALIPQQVELAEQFQSRFGKSIWQYIKSCTCEGYLKLLSQAGRISGISHPLTEKSAADGWIAAALELGIEPDLIAACVPVETSFSKHLRPGKYYNSEATKGALKAVADYLRDIRSHWHVMRCRESSPADTAREIRSHYSVPDIFTTPAATDKRFNRTASRLLDSLLFFRCQRETAAAIRHDIAPFAYVYCYAGTTIPAQISDTEMRTFMILTNIAGQTITCNFPEDTSIDMSDKIGSQARITAGNLNGKVGIISRISKDSYRVTVAFSTIGGARIYAEVPADALTLL